MKIVRSKHLLLRSLTAGRKLLMVQNPTTKEIAVAAEKTDIQIVEIDYYYYYTCRMALFFLIFFINLIKIYFFGIKY
jgi:hypothetical protein